MLLIKMYWFHLFIILKKEKKIKNTDKNNGYYTEESK